METVTGEKAHRIAATARKYIGSTRFRHRYRPIRQEEAIFGWAIVDVANDGDDSCAAFASHVLAANGLMKRTRSTIGTMVEAMQDKGWYPAEQAAVGAVALWGFRCDVTPDETGYGHSGIVVDTQTDSGLYVSHSSFVRTPVEHSAQLQDGREPAGFFVHDALFAC